MTDNNGDDNGRANGSDSSAFKMVLWPAIIGLIGGAVSGLGTSYVQLSAKKEEYSIARAQVFRELMEELLDDEKSRLAVLNLWQLYPDERDRRVITAAAFAVNQPDLVELVAGIDEAVSPVADMLHVRALSNDDEVRVPALRTLIKVDPIRAARLLIERLNEELELTNGELPPPVKDFSPTKELEQLTAADETVATMVKEQSRGAWPLYYHYILYRAELESEFIDRITGAFERGEDLDRVNDYLSRAVIVEADHEAVIESAADYLVTTINQEQFDQHELAGTMTSLKKSFFFKVIVDVMGAEHTTALLTVIGSDNNRTLLRKRALELLEIYDPRQAFVTFVDVRLASGADTTWSNMENRMLAGGKIAKIREDHPGFEPPDCGDKGLVECLRNTPDVWQDWLERQG